MMCHVITSTCALPTSHFLLYILSLFSPHYLFLVPCHDLHFHLCPFSYSILAIFLLLLVRFFSPFIPTLGVAVSILVSILKFVLGSIFGTYSCNI
ncbi:hypothetical protein BJ165DRAFT_1447734 [Panaeolus papilionaceus]|nr:hypothetical protein BJ165DRAFT_1447734 [Panaeolus papilionaceus]